MFCTFWLRNVLRATTACTFQHLNFQKCSESSFFLHFWCRSSCLQYHLCLPFACFFPCSWNAYKREKCQTSRLKPYSKYRKLVEYQHFFCRLLATGCWLLLALAAHLCLPFACFFPCSWNAYKREKCQTSRLKPYRKYSKYGKSAFFLVGCWLLVAGCYWRWLLSTGYVQSAGYWLLAATAAGCWLLAICRSSCLEYHLCLPFACFFPCSWNAYNKWEKCQTSRLKPYLENQHFFL